MNNYLVYILKVSCVFAFLYSLFYLTFKQLTFHWINRMLLLILIPMSFIIPIISIGIEQSIVGEIIIPQFDDFLPSNHELVNNETNSKLNLNISSYIFMLYSFGLIIYSFKLIKNSIKVICLKRKSQTNTLKGYLLIAADVKSIFSCFKWIFVPQNKINTYENVIIEHEKVHAKLWHTLDLILTELFVALLWFNPFVYFFRKSIKSVHEFQADEHVLKNNVKKSHYLKLMLNNLETNRLVGLYSYFNRLTIKNRIKMITTNKSRKRQLLKYLIIVPAMALLIMGFSNSSFISDNIIDENNIPNIKPINENSAPCIKPIKEADIIRITSGWGMRKHPIYGEMRMHYGVDILAAFGTPIIATADGIVTQKEFRGEKSYGKVVLIKHSDIYSSFYTQLSNYNVDLNQKVKQGDVIGYIGESGISTAPHIHYEVWKDGKRVNPEDYFK